jgi:drug/metabolite transporter (DMT)-like permease
MVLVQTNPVWTSILGLLINKEKVFCYEYIAMVLCFAGVVVLALSKQA